MEGPTREDPPFTACPEASFEAPADEHSPPFSDVDFRRRRLRDVFERSGSPMLMADDQRVYVDANPPVSRLLRLGRESIVGRRIDDLAAPHLRDRLSDGWDAFLRLGSAAGTYEYIGGGGQPVRFDFSATANVLPGTHLIILLEAETRPRTASAADEPAGSGELTPREQQVLRMVAMGKTGQEIAEALVLSPETVSTHVRNIREKLGARSRAHALAIALRRGEIQL